MPEIVAQRMFQPIYILLDSVFLVALCAMLFFRRRYLTLLFGLFGGILYFVVDYGIFHLWLGTRSIEGGSLFWVLLWMSLSYGVTNFVLIWTWISKDENAREWTLFILLWWFVCPLLTDALGNGDVIKIQRTTGAYHGWMAAILFLSYAALILFNILRKDKSLRFPLLRLFLIGVFVQFGWELSLLIGGIRSAGIESAADKLTVLLVNSLLETNLGMPLIYIIFLLITSVFTEDLKRRGGKVTLSERLKENLAEGSLKAEKA